MNIINWRVFIFLSLCMISTGCARKLSIKLTKTGDDIRKEVKEGKIKEIKQENSSSETSVTNQKPIGLSSTSQKPKENKSIVAPPDVSPNEEKVEPSQVIRPDLIIDTPGQHLIPIHLIFVSSRKVLKKLLSRS